MHVVVIDDDVSISALLRQAAPADWQIASAHDGLQGIDLVRRLLPAVGADRLVIVLDVHMPYDGVLTCIQLRQLAPQTPIVPCTAYTEHVGVLADMGCHPVVLKPVEGATLANAVLHAGHRPPRPMTPLPVWRYLEQVARREEHVYRQSRRVRSCVALGATSLRVQALVALAQRVGWFVAALGEPGQRDWLRVAAAQRAVAAVLCDEAALDDSLSLAQEVQRPALIVTMTPYRGYHAWRRLTAAGLGGAVLVDPFPLDWLRTVLDLLIDDPLLRWRDPNLDRALEPFRPSERGLVELILDGVTNDAIVAMTGYRPQTVRRYRSAIFAAIGHAGHGSSEALRVWMDQRLRQRPLADWDARPQREDSHGESR